MELSGSHINTTYIIVPHFDDTVLWWATTLPAEHAVNGGGQVGHSQRIFGQAQFPGVLVHFVVLQPSERLVGG